MSSSRTPLVVAAVVLTAAAAYIVHLRSEIARLERAAAVPNVAAAPAPAAAPAAAAAPARVLTPEQRSAMIAALGGAGVSQPHPVWFATPPNDREAAEFQRALQQVFEEAGWQVKGNAPLRFNVKPGVYLLAAAEESPAYVSMVQETFDAAGIAVTAGRGYREFYQAKKAENPSYVGIEMGPDQTYVIAIGRAPSP